MAARKPNYRPARQCWDTMWSPMRLRVLMTALELGIFDAIAAGAANAAAIAKKIKASARGTGMVLDELAALQFLKKSGDKYSLVAESETYLLKKSPTYMGGFLMHAFDLLRSWDNLTEIVRSGKPMMRLENTEQGEEFFKNLVRGLYASSYASGSILLPYLGLDKKSEVAVLDVAAGSAAWSLPIAEALPKSKVTVLDLPGVCEVAREFVDRHQVQQKYDYLEGDLRKLNLGVDKYDVIILGHICHSEGARWSEKLIAKCGKALKHGGQLVIPDMVPNDQRTGPEFPLLFAINMLVNTSEGSTFTLAEYKQWMKAAGIKFEKMLEPEVVGTQVIIGRKV